MIRFFYSSLYAHFLSTLLFFLTFGFIPSLHANSPTQPKLTYPIVDTNQHLYYDNTKNIQTPSKSNYLFQQDAGIQGNQPQYKDHHDGTISDLVTGLMWEKSMGEKLTYEEAILKAKNSKLGGYSDWRIPTIKELYSLIDFSGQSKGEQVLTPFINIKYFDQPIGDVSRGERPIDAQTWSSTRCISKVMDGRQQNNFGVNFVDGRIKAYPLRKRQNENKMYFRLVRGNPNYGINHFIDNKDGTISDLSTGLMWQKSDSQKLFSWEDAFQYARSLKVGNYQDWRLPNAKELQSIVDYSRSPSTTDSAAISPLFQCTSQMINNLKDYSYYWTSTTHLDGPQPGNQAVYISFGRAWGKNPRTGELCDVHGSGAQRSDPKSGSTSDYPQYFGPQGDRRCVYNAVRCVRDIKNPTQKNLETPKLLQTSSKNEVTGKDSSNSLLIPISVKENSKKNTWNFAVVGDTHVPQSNHIETIVNDLLTRNVEVVLFVGDLVQGGKNLHGKELREELETWQNYILPLKKAGITILAIRGNHEADVKGNSIRPWQRIISPTLNIIKQHKNVTFIGLDNYEEKEHTVNIAWLTTALKQAEGSIIVPFGHEPAFTCGTFHPVGLDNDKETRNQFWELLQNKGITHYFCGHAHQYNVCQIEHQGKTLWQIVSGGGGGRLQRQRQNNDDAPEYKVTLKDFKSEHGYVLVHVSENKLTHQWIKSTDKN